MAHHFYMSTAQKPTAVTHALSCSLAGSSSIQDAPLHLVVVKGTWLEIHLVNQINPSSGSGDGDNDDDDASAGLSLLCEAPLYGTVAVLQKFRPEGEPQDRLLIVTERHHFCVLGLEVSGGVWQMSTLGHGDLRDRVGQPVDSGPLAVVDPAGKIAALHLYDGLLKIMPLPTAAAAAEALLLGASSSSSSAIGAATTEPYTARLDEPSVADLCFLHTSPAANPASMSAASTAPSPPLPAIAVLYDSGSNSSSGTRVRKLKTYSVGDRDQELMAGPWPVTDVDAGAALLVPVPLPLGGVLVLGAGLVAYQPPPSSKISAAASSSSSGAGAGGSSSSDRARSSSSAAMVTAALDFETEITACCAIDEHDEHSATTVAGSRWLLGDSLGRLLVLTLHTAATAAADSSAAADSDAEEEESSLLRVTRLGVSVVGGETSVAEALCFLKHTKGMCFVGSLFGDSQLVRLPSSPQPQSSLSLEASSSSSSSSLSGSNNTSLPSLEIVEEFTNLGPIVDFVATDVDGSSLNSTSSGGGGGQAQVVTCSGAGKDGSLRVVRSGVGFDERAAVGMAGVKGLWALRDRNHTVPDGEEGGEEDGLFDRYLVTSFIGDTRVLGLSDEDELEEVDVSSSFLPGQTLYTANVATAGGGAAAADSSSPSLVLQVTSDGAQLLHSEGLTKLPDPRALWSAQSFTSSDDGDDVVGGGGGAAAITSACAAGSSVVVALRGGSLVALAVEPAAEDSSSVVLSKRASVTLENDIACLDVATGGDLGGSTPSLLAVGTWTDLKVHLLDPTTLQTLAFVQLGGDNQARSVCLAAVAGIPSLFVGLGDGRLLSYAFETPNNAAAADAATMEEDDLTATSASTSLLPAPPATATSALLPPPLPAAGATAPPLVVGVRKELSVGATPVLLTRFRQAPPANLHPSSATPSSEGAASSGGESSSTTASSSSEGGGGGGGGAVAVFAACDRPAMVYGEGGNYATTAPSSSDFMPGRVRLSSVACGGSVAHVSPFHAKAFPHTLAFAVERAKTTNKSNKSSSGSGSGCGGMMAVNDDDDEEVEGDDDDDSEALVIGSLEATQRLHVRRVGLSGWQPRRICHLPEAKCVAVACCFAPPGGAMEQHAIRVFDLQSFDEVAHWPLLDAEECLCLTTTTHPAWSAASSLHPGSNTTGGGSGNMGDSSSGGGSESGGECIVVGTAFSADDQEYEPSAGRLLVLSLTLHKSGPGSFGAATSPVRTSSSSRGSFSPSGTTGSSSGATLEAMCERAVKGAVYDVSPLGHALLACGVGPKVQLFKWAQRAILPPGSSSGESGSSSSSSNSSPLSWGLEPECAHQGHILALHVKGQRVPASQLASKAAATASSQSSSSSSSVAGGERGTASSSATAAGASATEPSSEATAAAAESFIVVVGDLMKSVSVLEYDPIAHTLTESLQDFNNNWITALEPTSDSVWVCGEHMSNLLTFKRSATAPKARGGEPSRPGFGGSGSANNKGKLEVCGEFHLGDFVNRLREGSLAMLPPTASTNVGNAATTATEATAESGGATAESGTAVDGSGGGLGASLLFGTVGGRVGTLSPLSEVEYHLFVGLQRAITKVVLRDPKSYGTRAAVGNLSHSSFRCFENEAKSSEWRGYIDGDLVESFLSLPPKASLAVVKLLLDDGFIGPNFLSASASGTDSGRLPALEVQAELVRHIEEMARRH